MMERMWSEILERFGQDVVLHGEEGDVALRALIQPVLDRSRDQEIPGPLGLERQERSRYMGPAAHPVGLDTVVEQGGRAYRVLSAHLVGDRVCPHWWAMLCPREEGTL